MRNWMKPSVILLALVLLSPLQGVRLYGSEETSGQGDYQILLGEIETLRAELEDLRTDVDQLKADVKRLQGRYFETSQEAREQPVRIEFIRVPPKGAGAELRGNIEGRIHGLADPGSYRIVLYAHADWWYVQPLRDDPFTSISPDGRWSSWTHLGDRYAALLVKQSYRPKDRVQSLPHVGGEVIAIAEAAGGE